MQTYYRIRTLDPYGLLSYRTVSHISTNVCFSYSPLASRPAPPSACSCWSFGYPYRNNARSPSAPSSSTPQLCACPLTCEHSTSLHLIRALWPRFCLAGVRVKLLAVDAIYYYYQMVSVLKLFSSSHDHCDHAVVVPCPLEIDSESPSALARLTGTMSCKRYAAMLLCSVHYLGSVMTKLV